MKCKNYLLLLLSIWCTTVVFGQEKHQNSLELISSASTLGEFEYSFGEWITGTSSELDGRYLTQGFVQLSKEKDVEIISEQIRIYPNPTSYSINIDGLDHSSQSSIEICNQLGFIVMTNMIDAKNTNINIESLVSGIYYLKISNKNRESQIVKFIKI